MEEMCAKATRPDSFSRLAALRVTFSKRQFLDIFLGSVCTKFQVCIVFRLVGKSRTDKPTNPQIIGCDSSQQRERHTPDYFPPENDPPNDGDTAARATTTQPTRLKENALKYC